MSIFKLIQNYLPKTLIDNELIVDTIIGNCSQQLTSVYFPIENRVQSFAIIIRGYLANAHDNVLLFDPNGNSKHNLL